ncbi:MAG: cell division protein FtsQ/DivIB [Candidatus Omnitrophota bacterium]
MKRQKKTRKMKFPSFLKGAKDAVFERSVLILVLIVFLVTVVFLGKAFLYRSDYFRLKSVEAKSPFFDLKTAHAISSQILELYHGRNIFRINLKGIADSLQDAYPDAKEVVARIALPDRIAVTMKFRKPVAVVRDGKLYPVDEEGFVLPSMDIGSLKDLPVIDGVDIRYDERRGKKNTSGNLKLALELLRNIREVRPLTEYGLAGIDAKDGKNLSFLLKSGTKVIVGSENFKERLWLLEKTLKDPRLVLDRIEYIDVRFNDAVVGPK